MFFESAVRALRNAATALKPGGKVCLVPPPPGPEGGVEGEGSWQGSDAPAFTFRVKERFFDTHVYLDLHVRVKSEWREDDAVLDDILR